MNFVAIDFEMANYEASRAYSVGLVKVVGGEIVKTAVHLIRPPTKEFVFTYIHGLTWKDVAKSDDFRKLWPTLGSFLEGAQFIAAHNAPFDKGSFTPAASTTGLPRPCLHSVAPCRSRDAHGTSTRPSSPTSAATSGST